MSQSARQALGLLLLFGGMAFAYLWLGVPGVAGMWIGGAVMWAVTGLSVGYWMGLDPLAERMVPELMRRLRVERAATDRRGHLSD